MFSFCFYQFDLKYAVLTKIKINILIHSYVSFMASSRFISMEMHLTDVIYINNTFKLYFVNYFLFMANYRLTALSASNISI